MLGRLAKSLRMLGYDVLYRSDIADSELKLLAVREGRILLTRDTEIAETRLPAQVLLVESDERGNQLKQVVRTFGLSPTDRLFTRCIVCNAVLRTVTKADVKGEVPPYVYEHRDSFKRCPECRRVYWSATHVERARAWLRGLFGVEAFEQEAPDEPHET
jgi:uncharacterized protein with PIN domain